MKTTLESPKTNLIVLKFHTLVYNEHLETTIVSTEAQSGGIFTLDKKNHGV